MTGDSRLEEIFKKLRHIKNDYDAHINDNRIYIMPKYLFVLRTL